MSQVHIHPLRYSAGFKEVLFVPWVMRLSATRLILNRIELTKTNKLLNYEPCKKGWWWTFYR